MFNDVTYPNFCSFLKQLGLGWHASDTSWSHSRDDGALEWASRDLASFLLQRENWFRLSHWRTLWDMFRFNATAPRGLLSPETTETLAEFVEREGYSHTFRDEYLVVRTATKSIASVPDRLRSH